MEHPTVGNQRVTFRQFRIFFIELASQVTFNDHLNYWKSVTLSSLAIICMTTYDRKITYWSEKSIRWIVRNQLRQNITYWCLLCNLPASVSWVLTQVYTRTHTQSRTPRHTHTHNVMLYIISWFVELLSCVQLRVCALLCELTKIGSFQNNGGP